MKLFFTTLFLIVITVKVNAQIISGFGVKLGAGISNQSWDYSTDINWDFDNKFGISPRIFVDFLNLSWFQIETEIGYLQKGFKKKLPITTATQPEGTGEFINANNKLNYLSMSVLAKIKYETEFLSPYILCGPQLNVLLSKEIDMGWEEVFDEFSKSNIGISIGAGTEINKLLPFGILIEYRYEKDLANNYESPNINIKNYSHVVLLGIKI